MPASHRAGPLTQSCRTPGPPLTQPHAGPRWLRPLLRALEARPGLSMAPGRVGREALSTADVGPPEWLGPPPSGDGPIPGSVNRVKMILSFLKERRTGKDVATYRFLLVFTSGSSLPSSELDPSLGSAERKSDLHGQYGARGFGKPPGSTTSSRLSLKLGNQIPLNDGPRAFSYASGFLLKMDLCPVTIITILAGFP